MENTHILNVDLAQLNPRPSLSVIDVSFISLKKVLPKIKQLMDKKSTVLAMVKPQFEVGTQVTKEGCCPFRNRSKKCC